MSSPGARGNTPAHPPRLPWFGLKRRLSLRFGLLACVGGLLFPALGHAFTVSRTSDSVFYISNQVGSNNIRSMYAAYRITNDTGVAQSDVWVRLGSFTGGVIGLASGEDGLYHIGAMAPAAVTMAYLYLTASATTLVPQGHVVSVYQGNPTQAGAVLLTSQSFSITEVRTSLSAAANKVDVIIQGPDPAALGGTITMTVQGRTGTVGAGSSLDFTPASMSDWPADAFEVYSATITFNDIAGSNCGATILGAYSEQLNIPWSTTACYTAVYLMRARRTTISSTATSPLVHVASGTQYKHTDPSSFAGLGPIQPVASQVTLLKRANTSSALTADTLTYTLTLTNAASNSSCPANDPLCKNATVDDIRDTLPASPASPTYLAGSTRVGGVVAGDPSLSGGVLTWNGPFTVAAGGSLALTYRVLLPATAGTYANTALAHIGADQIDTTLTTSDNAPGRAVTVVHHPSDLQLTKRGPASVTSGGTIGYTLSAVNTGPRSASNVVLTDSLPSGVAFVSASNGGTVNGRLVTWPGVATLAVGDSVVRTVTVTAPGSGTLVNIGRGSTGNEDPDPSNNNGSATSSRVTTSVQQLPGADLELRKSGPTAAVVGDTLTYALTARNLGPDAATTVALLDSLPAGATFLSASAAGTFGSGVVAWPAVAALAAGDSLVRTVTVIATTAGNWVNVGAAGAATADPVPANNNGSASNSRVTVNVVPVPPPPPPGAQADLALWKSGPASAVVGDTLTFTLVVRNGGPSDASTVRVRDPLPAGLAFLDAGHGGTASAGVVSWPTVATLAAGDSLRYSLRLLAAAAGTWLNAGKADSATPDSLAGNNDGSNPASRVTTVIAPPPPPPSTADLIMTKTGPSSAAAGDTLTYTLTAHNAGPDTAFDIVIRDILPAGATFLSASAGGWPGSGVVTWPVVVSLAAGDSLVRTVTLLAPYADTWLNIGTVACTTPDPVDENNDGTDPGSRVTTSIQPPPPPPGPVADLRVTKFGPTAAVLGDTLTYTVILRNAGPDAALAVSVQDSLPAGLSFLEAHPVGTAAAGVIAWPTIGTLPAGGSVTRTISVVAAQAGTWTNIALAHSTTADDSLENNDGRAPGSRVTTVVTTQPPPPPPEPRADLRLTKLGPATAPAGDTLTYTIILANDGPSAATTVAVRDTLPGEAQFLFADQGGTLAGHVVTWPTVERLAANQSLVRTVRVLAPAPGHWLNVATASSDVPDPIAGNSDGSGPNNRVPTLIYPRPRADSADLELVAEGPANGVAGQLLAYRLVARNLGPGAATVVALQDSLPAGLAFLSADAGGSLDGGVIRWPTLASLAAGDSVVRRVVLRGALVGRWTQSGAVAARTVDPFPGNNDGSWIRSMVTTTIEPPPGASADIVVTQLGPTEAAPGDTLNYTIELRNDGPDTALAVRLESRLPAGSAFLSADSIGTESEGAVTWPVLARLQPGGRLTRRVSARAPDAGPLVCAALALADTPDPNPGNNDETNAAGRVTTRIVVPNPSVADVGLELSGPATSRVGDRLHYTITVTNHGPATAEGVALTDSLPPGATSPEASDGGAASGRVVTWPPLASLQPGARIVRTLSYAPPEVHVVVNSALVAAATPDPDPSNNDASNGLGRVSTRLTRVDLAARVSHMGTLARGALATYLVAITNVGEEIPRAGFRVTNPLPAGLQFRSAAGAGWSFRVEEGVLFAEFGGPLPVGQSTGYSLQLFVDPAAAGPVTNGVTVSCTEDWNQANDLASDTSELAPLAASLSLEMIQVQSDVEMADFLDYRLTVRNTGPLSIPDVLLNIQLPPGIAYVRGSARHAGQVPANGADSDGAALRIALGALDPDALTQLDFRGVVRPGAALGTGLTRATAASPTLGVASNEAIAAVTVRRGFASLEGSLIGRVYAIDPADSTRLERGAGIPGVRLVLDDGTSALTDARGRYHFAGLAPRAHLLRLDESTLPPGCAVQALDNRQAGVGGSRFVDLTDGELFRADFVIRVDSDAAQEIVRRAATVEPTEVDAAGFDPWTARPEAARASESDSTRGEPVVASGSQGGAAAAATPSMPRGLLALGLLQGRLEFWQRAGGVFTRHNRFADELRRLSTTSDDGRTTAAARGLLFLKGTVAGHFLLTAHYDSEADTHGRLFRDIRPDEGYTLFGDGSVPGFDARSRDGLYLRVEDRASFAQYGDYSTASEDQLRSLGVLNRALNGGLTHLEGARGSLNVFASRGLSRQRVDELPGLGISGPYRLSGATGLTNSERVEILTRDRDQPAVILRREPQQRFVDYTIEPFTGRLVFRRAVPGFDENLNPVSILVAYEVESGGERAWVYGARGRLNVDEHLSLGGAGWHDEDPTANRSLASGNATLQSGPLTALGEFARSDSAGATGNALRGEFRVDGAAFDLKAYAVRTDASFANPSAAWGPGRLEWGGQADLRAGAGTRLFGEAIHTESRVTGGRRDGARLGVARRFGNALTGELAFRSAHETRVAAGAETAEPVDTTPANTTSLGGKLTGRLTEKARLFAEYEQDLEQGDQRRASVGGDYRFAERTRLFVRHDVESSFAGAFALNRVQERAQTVVGLASDDTRAGSVFSEYRVRDAVDGRTAQAAIGLRNRLALRPGAHLEFSGERITDLRGSTRPTSTAAGIGLALTGDPDWRGTARLDWRWSRTGDQAIGSLGLVDRLGAAWTLLARSSIGVLPARELHAHSNLGLAWREVEQNRWAALARYEHRYERGARTVGAPAAQSRTHLAFLNVDRQIGPGFQLRGQAATRWNSETRDAVTSRANASLLALRATRDLNAWLDAGLIGRTLFSDGLDHHQNGAGLELGVIPLHNLRLAAGYNVFGYRDADLTGGSHSERGAYLEFMLKLDEGSLGFPGRR